MSRQPRRSAARRLMGWTANLALAAVTLVCLGWIAPSLLGWERYVITGGSMSGTFERGSLAFEKPVPTEHLRVGDVITYQPPATSGSTDLVTHRIVRINRDALGRRVLRTKGDANASVDPWRFRLDRPTQPVVQHTVPYAGHVFIALADRETRMLLIGAPAGLVALLALGELVRAVTRKDGGEATWEAPVPSQRAPHRLEGPVVVPAGRA